MHPRYRRWGSAVVVFNPALEFEPVESAPLNGFRQPNALWISHPGSWSAIKLTQADQPPITLVSAYGAWDIATADQQSSYYQTTVHRIMSDLTPLLDSEDGQRTVLAGDLNVGTQYTDPSPQEPYHWGPSMRALFDDSRLSGWSSASLWACQLIAGHSRVACAGPHPIVGTSRPTGTATWSVASRGRTSTFSLAARWRMGSSLARRSMMKRPGL